MENSKKLKLPFGILENGKLIEKFSENPKIAAKQFLESEIKTGLLEETLEKLFPHKNFQNWMNEFGIVLTNLKLKNVERDEEKLILASRTLEELTHFINVLRNREKILANYETYKKTCENAEKLKEKLEEKIRENTREIAPNISALLGPILASDMIAKARSLKNLSKMPASKIQILGAEKSLFKYLEEKQKIPKYGLIYKSNFIQDAKKQNRGKVARLLAAKIMLAARLDYFSDEDKGDELREKLIKELNKLDKN